MARGRGRAVAQPEWVELTEQHELVTAEVDRERHVSQREHGLNAASATRTFVERLLRRLVVQLSVAAAADDGSGGPRCAGGSPVVVPPLELGRVACRGQPPGGCKVRVKCFPHRCAVPVPQTIFGYCKGREFRQGVEPPAASAPPGAEKAAVPRRTSRWEQAPAAAVAERNALKEAVRRVVDEVDESVVDDGEPLDRYVELPKCLSGGPAVPQTDALVLKREAATPGASDENETEGAAISTPRETSVETHPRVQMNPATTGSEAAEVQQRRLESPVRVVDKLGMTEVPFSLCPPLLRRSLAPVLRSSPSTSFSPVGGGGTVARGLGRRGGPRGTAGGARRIIDRTESFHNIFCHGALHGGATSNRPPPL